MKNEISKLSPLSIEKAEELTDLGERIFAIAVASIEHLEIYHQPASFRRHGHGKYST